MGHFPGLFLLGVRLVELVELSMPTVLFNITNDVLKQVHCNKTFTVLYFWGGMAT